MKYGALSSRAVKKAVMPPFAAGVFTGGKTDTVAYKYLAECKNMWFKDGALKTRLGINCEETDTFGDVDAYSFCIHPFELTDTVIYKDNVPYGMGVCVDYDGFSYETVRMFLVNENGEVTPCGNIELQRIDSEAFYRFERIFFVSAGARLGCGVFAFLTKANFYGDHQKSYSVYELSADYSEWSPLNMNAAHVPIIYMNGRGNNYSVMQEGVAPYPYEPIVPEARNLLNGAFKAYFSTDGYSDKFRLPLVNLDDETITIKIYTAPGICGEWTVYSSGTSSEISFFGYQVTAHVDRVNGVVYFTVPQGEFTPPSFDDYKGNNLEVFAYKTIEGGIERVVSAKHSAVYNSRLFLCGSDAAPDEIVSSRLSDILYFPSDATISTGNPESAVTALAVVCNKLIAFKKDRIYKIDVTSGKAFVAEGQLPSASTDFLYTDKLTASEVHSEIGCDLPNTLRCCSNRLIWFTKNKKAYTLATTTYGKENNIFSVSAFIEDRLNALPDNDVNRSFALCEDGHYLLFAGNKVFVMDFRIKDFGYPERYAGEKENGNAVSWYLWDINENLCYRTAAAVNGKCVFALNSGDKSLHYTAVFDGENDVSAVISSDEEIIYTRYPVESFFETCELDFGCFDTLKNISKINLLLSLFEIAEINLITDKTQKKLFLRPKDGNTVYGILPSLCGARYLKMRLKSKRAFSLGNISVFYNDTKDVI